MLVGHMRYPESEEHCVVAAVRSPGEEIGFDESHRFVPVPSTRPGQHLRCGVYGSDGRCKASEVLSPNTSAACEFQHIACWTKRVDGREQLIQTDEIKTGVDTLILVVARGSSIERDLLREDRVFHAPRLAYG